MCLIRLILNAIVYNVLLPHFTAWLRIFVKYRETQTMLTLVSPSPHTPKIKLKKKKKVCLRMGPTVAQTRGPKLMKQQRE